MKNDSTHPARSADFLSRLHDGELTAAERAHFESHRAHCADCRAAASEFETALSLFRASTTSPPSADLAARILRGLESTTRRRPPFGVVFGINLKWAAAFSTALIAVIIGSAVVVQRERIRSVAARETPIPVVLQPRAAPRPAPAPLEEEVARRERAPAARAPNADVRKAAPPAPASAPLRESLTVSREQPFAASPPPQAAASAEQKAHAFSRRAAPARVEEPDRSAGIDEAAPAGALKKPEIAGGEGAATSSAASSEPGPPARLVLVSLDGAGDAPEIVSAGAAERLSDLRGRQFILIVEASGRVREARVEGRRERFQKRNVTRDAAEIAAAPPSVSGLRFRPADRPRRILLRIE
jgi:hypothetical protein